MQLQRYFSVLLTTPLLVALTSHSGLAFSVNLPAAAPDSPCKLFSAYCVSRTYRSPTFGTVTTTLAPVSRLPIGGTAAFLNLLNSSIWAQNGWTFQKAKLLLIGSFDIKAYAAYADPNRPSVGATIQIDYNPGSTSFRQDPIGSNVHWIQRVVSNHATRATINGTTDLGHGNNEDKIDVFTGQTIPAFTNVFNPFYDTSSPAANSTSFGDLIGRPDLTENHNWSAQLFLVELTAPKTVTIYNGISWGWSNTFTPPPPPPPPPTPIGGSGGGGFRIANISLKPELPMFDTDSKDSNNYSQIPNSTCGWQ
jgi:hypothetical protein